MRLALLGLPGAGKGTQGRRLAAHLDVSHVSLGDLARATMEPRGSSPWRPMGDEEATALVSGATTSLEGFVLDGWPRNVRQWELRPVWLSDVVFIELRISADVARARCAARARVGDDTEARLTAEAARLPPLLSLLRPPFIDAEQAEELVFTSILESIGVGHAV